MKKYLSVCLIFLLALNLNASPLHNKLNRSIIINTDCSENDLRAISLLVSNSAIIIKAIMISEGQVPSDIGCRSVQNLLHELKADTIPVSIWNKLFLRNNLSASDSHLTLVCLGPLTSVSEEFDNNNGFSKKIDEIIWYIDSADPLNGYNYEYDKRSSAHLLSYGVRIDVISNPYKNSMFFDNEFMDFCSKARTNLSKAVYNTLSNIPTSIDSRQSTSILAEELVAVFLGNQELFELSPMEANPYIRYNKTYSLTAVKEVFKDMIAGKYRSGHFVALYGFPLNPELYVYDVREIMESALLKYGIEEWKACTLTDEFHGHLGVFSIVGAKMGIMARDYFGIGADLLEIASYAGSTEPFSCLNDGLQVSTGATLGQGSIELINDTIAKPQAIFTYHNKSILIRLKDDYLKKIRSVIDRGIKNYGLQDDDYWNLIRQTSIKYWLEWDRKEIFDLVLL